MKSIFLGLLALLLATTSGYAQADKAKPTQLNVALVVFPGVETLDLTEPLDVLHIASGLTNNGYRCYTVAISDSLLPTSGGGLHLRPDYTFQTMPKPDIVIVPGASPTRIQELAASPLLIAQLRALAPRTQLIMSVCTGGVLLAQAGLLDGHRATTHAMTLDSLAQYPTIKVVRGVRFVDDGPVLTTAGITAGIDGTLGLVERYSGRVVADAVASVLEYKRPGADTLALVKTSRPTATARHRSPPLKRPGMPMPRMTMAKMAMPTAVSSSPQPSAEASASAALASVTDPVCHMAIAPTTKRRYTYQGKTYGFCSEACHSVFVAKPRQYVP